jgi:thioredoxin
VVVDCWADWCGPCKQFSPVFEATAKQYVGVVKFAKLDTEAEKALAAGLGVRALPTVLMFYKGQLANAIEGALPAEQFQVWIYQTLTAIRQYESQFEAEAAGAVDTAAQNVASLDGQDGHEPAEPEPLGLIVGHDSPPPQGSRPSPGATQPPPGKQTSSGLYIP